MSFRTATSCSVMAAIRLAREITSRAEKVFDYISKSRQVFGTARLANGNTLVAEQEPCQAVEVNPKGGSFTSRP